MIGPATTNIFAASPVISPSDLNSSAGEGDAVGKTRYRHDGSRPGSFADAVVYAQPREQASEKDERHGNGARKLLPFEGKQRLKLDAQELPHAADQPAPR